MEKIKMNSIIQFAIVGFLLFSICSTNSYSQDIQLISEPEKLFKKGDAGIAEFRIPSMITTIKGTILTVCDARVDRPGDVPNNIDLVMRRLKKGSKEWTPIERIVDFAGDHGAADPSLIQDRSTGRIFLFYGFCPGRNNISEGANRDRRHLMLQYVTSDDDGESWSTPVHIDYEIREDNWHSAWSSPGRGLQLKNGRIVIPCTIYKTDGHMYSSLVYSDDHGKTWQCSDVVTDINEPTLVELSNGELMINARNQIAPRKFRAITVSSDGGKSWSEVKIEKQLPDPNCQGSLISFTFNKGRKESDLLIFSNNATNDGRNNLSVIISEDEGKTWINRILIHEGPSAYSCLTILPDGNIGLLYENGENSPYEAISFIKLKIKK